MDVMEIINELLSDDVLEESKRDQNSYESFLKVMFEHMIKMEVCKNKQDSDWVRSIRHSHDSLKKMKKSDIDKLNRSVDKIYTDARKIAYKNLKDWTYVSTVSPEERPDYYSVENVVDQNFIDDFLESNAYSEKVRIYLGLNKKLPKDKNKDIENLIKLKEAFPGLK